MASNSLHEKAPTSLPTATYSSRLVQPRPSQSQSQQLLQHQSHSQINLSQSLFKQQQQSLFLSSSSISSSSAVNNNIHLHNNNITNAFTITTTTHNNTTLSRSATADAKAHFHRSDMLDSNNIQTNNIIPSFRNNQNVTIALSAQQHQQQQSQQQSLFAINSQSSVANSGVAAAAGAVGNNSSNNNTNNNGSTSSNGSLNGNNSSSGPPSTLDLSEFPSLSGSLPAIGSSINSSSSNPNNNTINSNGNPNTIQNSLITSNTTIGSSNGSSSSSSVNINNSRENVNNSQLLLGPNLIGNSNNSGRPYVGIIKDGSLTNTAVSSTAEFNIHSEDFPALSGSSLNGPTTLTDSIGNNNDLSGKVGSSSNTIGSGLFGTSCPTSASIGGGSSLNSVINNHSVSSQLNGLSSQTLDSNDLKTTNQSQINSQLVSSNLKQSASTTQSLQQQNRGIHISKDGRVSNIPGGMLTDQFGMVGLLAFIRAADSDPNLRNLAICSDISTLNVDLNSLDNMYSSFPGPWSDIPLKPHEIDYPVPQEYLINNQIRDKLAPIKLSRYGDDTLFFLFYLFPNEGVQTAAANELYLRDWRFHKDEKVWITRAPGIPPLEKTNTYERGTYYFFDAINWRRVAKEFHLDYDRLENRQVSVNHGNNLGAQPNAAPVGNNLVGL